MCNTNNPASTILQNMGVGIYLIDSEMNLLWFNEEIKNWFMNLNKTTEKGKCYELIFSREFICNNCPAMRQHDQLKIEISNIQLSSFKGNKRLYRFQAKSIDNNQRIIMVMDITDQYQSEKMREDFIATLTHDLRTPLLAEIRTLELLTNGTLGVLNEKQMEVLQAMLISNRDLLSVVKTLLEVYRYEAGAKVLSSQNFDISQLIEDCVFELSALAEPKNILLTSEIPEVLPLVFADKREIWRVLINLIGNAIEYTQESGKVWVNVSINTNCIVVEVGDNGKGIPVAEIDQLFERFSQGTSDSISSGTGLGLYLSKQIIQAHNGKIWTKSEPGRGSRFYFSLPTNT